MGEHKQFNSIVRNKTRELLREHLKLKVNTFASISKVTGLTDTWIIMFNKGSLKHTDIGRVETLYNYLAKEPLKI